MYRARNAHVEATNQTNLLQSAGKFNMQIGEIDMSRAEYSTIAARPRLGVQS